MTKLKAVHIDDEQDSLDVLAILLKENCPHIELVGSAKSVTDGISLIERVEPHVVFLDVEMPGRNGFDLLNAIPIKTFHTIMVTGYEGYALKAIQFSALDYLLKPLNVDELVLSLEKINPSLIDTDPRLLNFAELLDNEVKIYDSLMVSSVSGYQNIALDSILYFESSPGSYSFLHLENGNKILTTKTLSHFESLLETNRFHRIHRSFLVNLDKITKFDSRLGEISIINGSILSVAVRKKADLRKRMDES